MLGRIFSTLFFIALLAAGCSAVESGRQAATEAPPLATAPPSPLPFSCVEKTCGGMTSCEEAVYQLTICGHTQRDGDGDGVPCAALCRGADVRAIATSFAISPAPRASGRKLRATRYGIADKELV